MPRAKGEADQKLSEAEGDALKRINESIGDAARFKAIYAAYANAPDVTRQRLYFETMSEILPGSATKSSSTKPLPTSSPFFPSPPARRSQSPRRHPRPPTPATAVRR